MDNLSRLHEKDNFDFNLFSDYDTSDITTICSC